MAHNWSKTYLASVATWSSGGTPAKSRADYWTGDVPWVSPKDMKRFSIDDTEDHISERAITDGARMVPKGTVFVVVRGMILAHTFPVCIAERAMSFNQDVKALVPQPGTDGRYLAHWLRGHSDQLLRLVTEATHGTKRIELRELVASTILMPQLPEQRRIAEILDTLDETIRKTEQIIAKLKQVKHGLLHDLLTRGIDDNGELRDPARHPAQFKDSQLGRVPNSWDVKPLDNLVDNARPIAYGILMPGTGHRGGVPVIKVKDIVGGRIKLDGLLLTSPALDYEYRRSRVRAGDLLFTIRGTVGRMAVVPSQLENANITQDTARIAIKGASVSFVRHYLGMPGPHRFIAMHTLGVAVQGINLRDVRRVPIATPPRAEADEIANRIDWFDARNTAENDQTAKLRLLKQGLTEDLLAGRVRVTNLLDEAAA